MNKLQDSTDWAQAPAGLQNILQYARDNNKRVRVWLGDRVHIWKEENDILGYLGISTGTSPCALLVYNARSMGGGCLPLGAVCRVALTDGSRSWVRDDDQWIEYRRGWSLGVELLGGAIRASHGKEAQARFETWDRARRYVDFMKGERFSK